MSDSEQMNANQESADDPLPSEVFQILKAQILAGVKPSLALRKLMTQYPISQFDPAAVLHMLKVTYPGIDVQQGGFRFQINDSNYPHSDPLQFSDKDFDDGVEKILRTY